MRTVSFSDRKVQNLLNNHFVNMFTNTAGDPTAGMSIKHSPTDSPGGCVRGNGKQNVQTIFMTPAGEIYHVATGFLPAEDLRTEIEFAGHLFAALQKEKHSKQQLVSESHHKRLAQLGFNDDEINGRNGFEQMMMMMGNGDRPQNPLSNSRDSQNLGGANGVFANLIKGQFLADNKFSIQHPLMEYSTFQDDPTPLVGNGKSFFASQSSNSNSGNGGNNGSQFVMPPINMPNFGNGSGRR